MTNDAVAENLQAAESYIRDRYGALSGRIGELRPDSSMVRATEGEFIIAPVAQEPPELNDRPYCTCGRYRLPWAGSITDLVGVVHRKNDSCSLPAPVGAQEPADPPRCVDCDGEADWGPYICGECANH